MLGLTLAHRLAQRGQRRHPPRSRRESSAASPLPGASAAWPGTATTTSPCSPTSTCAPCGPSWASTASCAGSRRAPASTPTAASTRCRTRSSSCASRRSGWSTSSAWRRRSSTPRAIARPAAARSDPGRRLAAPLVGRADLRRRSGCRCSEAKLGEQLPGRPRRPSSGRPSPGCTPPAGPASRRRCSATSAGGYARILGALRRDPGRRGRRDPHRPCRRRASTPIPAAACASSQHGGAARPSTRSWRPCRRRSPVAALPRARRGRAARLAGRPLPGHRLRLAAAEASRSPASTSPTSPTPASPSPPSSR